MVIFWANAFNILSKITKKRVNGKLPAVHFGHIRKVCISVTTFNNL